MKEITLPNGERFSDPIVLPKDAPIPYGVTNFRLVTRSQFDQAEMAAFDELPSSLRRAFNAHGGSCIFQLVLKGLKFGEFSEDAVYLAILARAPKPLSSRVQ